MCAAGEEEAAEEVKVALRQKGKRRKLNCLLVSSTQTGFQAPDSSAHGRQASDEQVGEHR